MGSILLDVERLPPRDWEREERASSSRPNTAGSNKMGRRQSQRNSAQPQLFPRQEDGPEKRPQRRKHKSKTRSSKSTPPPYSSQGTSSSGPAPSVGGRKEAEVLRSAPRWDRQRHGGRGTKHTAASSNHHRPRSSTELLEVQEDSVEDSDTDMSESEKGLLVSSCRPPQLDLRPEVIEDEDQSSHCHSTRGQAHGGSHYPDFLPPPFNLWSLSQLAVFYNTEGGATPRPRPVGPLERYLERLLQLEWHQIQTVQEELESLHVSEVTPGCHRSAAATWSCLSSPKCILQCQRAFPLTFLSSLASHSTFGCACTLCWIRCSTCSSSCCRSIHTNGRPSRLSPMPDRSRGHTSLPKRSYSESRVHSSDRTHPFQRLSSPSRTSSHLRRMQALGNIRNPVQSAPGRPHSTCRDSRVHTAKVDVSTIGQFRRSGSERRRGGVQRHQNRQEGSEFRKGRSDERRAAEFKNHKTKPESVSTVRDHVPRSKCPPNPGRGRAKAVDFVT